MTEFKLVTPREVIMGKLSYNGDLLEELTKVAVSHGVVLGRIEAIGAVQKARIGFYNQETREYRFLVFDQALEIVKLAGNISLKDGKPFVHAHITLADESGKSYGDILRKEPSCSRASLFWRSLTARHLTVARIKKPD